VRGTLIPQVGDADGYWVGQMRGGTPIAEVGEAMRNSRKTTKPAEVEANFLPAGRKSPSAREVGAGVALASVARGTAAGQSDPDRLADLLLEDLMSAPYRVSRWEEIPGLDRTAGAVPLSPAERVGRLESLLSREVTAIRQLGAHTLSVLLRPDADTALVVQLKQTDGVVEAAVKCDRGDLRDLQAHWPMLREALAEQNIRLLPLQAPSQESSAGNGARAQFSDDRQARQSGSELEGRRSGQEQGQESRQRSQGGSESGVRPLVAQVPGQASPRARGVRRDGWEFWA
jgi:hypothetical protein